MFSCIIHESSHPDVFSIKSLFFLHCQSLHFHSWLDFSSLAILFVTPLKYFSRKELWPWYGRNWSLSRCEYWSRFWLVGKYKKEKKKKMFALFSLVSLQPKQLFILSKLSLSGAYLFSLLPDLKIYHHFIFVFCLNIQSIFTSFTSFDPHKPVDRED